MHKQFSGWTLAKGLLTSVRCHLEEPMGEAASSKQNIEATRAGPHFRREDAAVSGHSPLNV